MTIELNRRAGLQKGLAQLAQDQDRKIVPLVAEQGTRVEQANGTLTTMQQALGDLTTAINRLQTQVVDLGNAVKVIQSPPVAPKPPSAEELLKSAQADRLGGKYDLAVQEYSEFREAIRRQRRWPTSRSSSSECCTTR